MPYNLLLLPLLGGYIFALRFNRTRYSVLRAEKERLLILASLFGVALVSVVWIVNVGASSVLPCKADSFCIPVWWHNNVGIEYSGISVSALVLGLVGWYPLNFLPWFKHKDREIDRVLERDCDPFELILRDSQQRSATVSVSTKNGKVYIGWINHDFNPATETKFISIVPIRSGYRMDETKRLMLTVNYSAVLEKMKQDREKLLVPIRAEMAKPDGERNIDFIKRFIIDYEKLSIDAKSFAIVIPVNEIVSINLYDRVVHTEYFLHPTALAPFKAGAQSNP